ncbi:RtcB family protein [Candidatus Woesearchaeota archaeon]|nr:RtcB family protein [Candidatus Woesearchaeota archaeon]
MKEKLERIDSFQWRLPKAVRPGMRVDAKVIASARMLDAIEEEAVQQLTNVAMLPGVVSPVIAMPDAHWGYGLPVGSVAAFDADEGIISAGLCGFDINCGINLIRTNLTVDDIRERKKEIIDTLFRKVPVGVGAKGTLRLSRAELDEVLTSGLAWAKKEGYATDDDLAHTEEGGRMAGADPSMVSDLAKERGLPQLGTLGAGNHFLELQAVDSLYDPAQAEAWGIAKEGQVMIMLHCGSRGLGHQVATDYLKVQERAVQKYGITLPDKQLACAPVQSEEGQRFFAAMQAAVNFSFANRQVMTSWIRESFAKVFDSPWEELDLSTVYGICHNVIKHEEHTVDGEKRKLYVHRKGATRSFPKTPVIIAGSMGTSSHLLVGTEEAMRTSFGSSAHGAGRAMSRHAAIASFRGDMIAKELERRGIISRAPSPKSLAEEAPEAYKDVDEVIASVHGAGISRKVARLVPVGVVKG